jgi:hypothetical protein
MADTIAKLKKLVESKNKGWAFRLKVTSGEAPTVWSRFFISPSDSYIETDAGPVPIRDIEYIDINPIEYRYVGRLVADKPYDHSGEIKMLLDDIGISYSQDDSFIRIRLSN